MTWDLTTLISPLRTTMGEASHYLAHEVFWSKAYYEDFNQFFNNRRQAPTLRLLFWRKKINKAQSSARITNNFSSHILIMQKNQSTTTLLSVPLNYQDNRLHIITCFQLYCLHESPPISLLLIWLWYTTSFHLFLMMVSWPFKSQNPMVKIS